MKFRKPGTGISKPEVSHISPNGIWLFVMGKERFMSYEDFPWFKDATIAQIHHVRLLNNRHLYWKDLDVDLEIESLDRLDQYPLKSTYLSASQVTALFKRR